MNYFFKCQLDFLYDVTLFSILISKLLMNKIRNKFYRMVGEESIDGGKNRVN